MPKKDWNLDIRPVFFYASLTLRHQHWHEHCFLKRIVYIKVWHKRPPLPLRLWETQVPSRYSFPSGASAKRKLQEKRISKPWNFSLQWIWIFNGIIAFFVSIFIASGFWRALWIERVMIGTELSLRRSILTELKLRANYSKFLAK